MDLKLTDDQKERLKFLARAELARRYAAEGDVLNWGKVCFPEKFTLPFCAELHQYFVDIKEDPFTSTLAPRGHAKTTIKCFLIPIFMALNTPEKFLHYLNIQATSTKAQAVNIAIKTEIEQNELIRYVYGDQQSKIKWTERQFVLKNGVIFSAIGAGESVRGLNWRNVRPDYIIIDDLYDDEQIGKKDQIMKLNGWFWRSVYKCVSPSKSNSIHIQGTAFAKYDLMHELAGKTGITYEKFEALNYETKTPLWVELNTYEQLMLDKEKMGTSIFSREMQNEVRSEETSLIKEAWIQFYDVIPENETIIKRIIGLDPSIGAKAQSDFTGCAVCYATKDELNVNRWYFCKLVEEHLSLQKRIDLMKELQAEHKADIIVIEAIAGFQDFFLETVRTTNLPVKIMNKTVDKMTALEHQQHKFENGKVFFKRGIANLETLVEQLIENKPEHDDVRDSVIICLKEDVTMPTFEVL